MNYLIILKKIIMYVPQTFSVSDIVFNQVLEVSRSNESIEQIINLLIGILQNSDCLMLQRKKCNYPECSDTNHAYHKAKITCLVLHKHLSPIRHELTISLASIHAMANSSFTTKVASTNNGRRHGGGGAAAATEARRERLPRQRLHGRNALRAAARLGHHLKLMIAWRRHRGGGDDIVDARRAAGAGEGGG